ncbi:hypothetical protein TNCV_1001621 [Trichonephila clavipes]|nr:hypothetical protein TNCV_1001621 [Trichonephila clavipes]
MLVPHSVRNAAVDNMVKTLPCDFDDDCAINVHIRGKKLHRSSYLMGYVKKHVIRIWLKYLINQDPYKFYGFTVDNSNCNAEDPPIDQIGREEFSEVIEITETLTAQ